MFPLETCPLPETDPPLPTQPSARGFAVHPSRWVVELTLAWLTAHWPATTSANRRFSEAIIRWAAINGMFRRITRGRPTRRQLRRAFTWP